VSHRVSIWKKSAIIVFALSLLAASLSGCRPSGSNSSASSGGKPVPGGTIQLDFNYNIKDLDPAKAYDTASYEPVEVMYDRLVTYQGSTSDIVPMLAKSWDISQDGLTYTFHLTPGVKFWNGDPVTAQSFIDEFQRVLDPNVGSGGEGFLDPIVVGSTAFNKGQAKTVTGLSAADPNTMVIKLTQPQPFFLMVMAMPFFAAVDESYIKKVGNQAFDTTTAMGSGPFELQSYNGTQCVLTKNPSYFMVDQYGNHLPYLDKIVMTVNKDDQIDGMHFQQGQTAFIAWNMEGIPSDIYPKFISDPTLSKMVVTQPQNSTRYLGMNSKMKPFDNVLVRQAIEYAIDKQQIATLLNNRVDVANQPLPPGITGYVKNLAPDATYTYDPAKAKQLLAQAGYPNGGLTVTLTSDNQPDRMKIDAAVQNMLQAVGIKVNIDAMDWNSELAICEKGQAAFYQMAWIQDFPDASDFLNTLFNSSQAPINNMSNYSNPQVDQWLNQAQTMPNGDARWQVYEQVTNQVMKDASWVPMYYDKTIDAVQPWVHGFYMNQTLVDPFQYIWIDQSHSNNG